MENFGNIKDTFKNIVIESVLKKEEDVKVHRQDLLGFDYKYLENDSMGANIVKINLPCEMQNEFSSKRKKD